MLLVFGFVVIMRARVCVCVGGWGGPSLVCFWCLRVKVLYRVQCVGFSGLLVKMSELRNPVSLGFVVCWLGFALPEVRVRGFRFRV